MVGKQIESNNDFVTNLTCQLIEERKKSFYFGLNLMEIYLQKLFFSSLIGYLGWNYTLLIYYVMNTPGKKVIESYLYDSKGLYGTDIL